MIRAATISDLESILSIVRSAQLSLRELGIDQWQDGYPSKECIVDDIAKNLGYVICVNGSIAGYAAIVLSGETAYRQIDGLWRAGESYVVVHRLCVDSLARRRGLAIELMRHAATIARNANYEAFRIDTHRGNIRMLSMMRKLGFSHVGKIVYDSGEREAYELNLDLSKTL